MSTRCQLIRTSTVTLLLLIAGAAIAADSDLARSVGQKDGWVSWQVPMADGVGTPCCWDWHDHHPAVRVECDLDSHSWNIGSNDDDARSAAGADLAVYVHVEHGEVDRIRSYAATCPVRSAGQVHRLDSIAGADSVAWLAGVAAQWQHENGDAAMASLAMHADSTATPALKRLADASHARNVREQALFWLAQDRGADGAKFIERVASSDADDELREKAIFALSESHGIDAYAAIHDIAQRDGSDRVREQAYFWMAQMHDKRAKADILAAISNDASEHVREQAVFALSQLEHDGGEDALIAIMRGNYPRKVKEQALFWLGQSGSDAAMKFIDEVLTEPAGKSSRR